MEQKELRDYQVADLAFYMATPKCGNFSDPGTGKTPSVCVYIWWLWHERKIRSIWTMPKSLLAKNKQELLDFTDLKEEDVVIIDGPAGLRDKLIRKDGKVFLMGFSNFATNWKQYVEVHPDINALFGDEWHLGFSTDAAQRTQSLYEFMDRTEILVAMTGTIINGRLDSAYPLIQICSPESYSGGWHDFQMTHAVENSYGQIVDWRYPGQVGDIFRKIAIRHSFDEVYGPEAKELQHELCMMDPKQREAYLEFEETALLELENDWLDGTLPGVAMIRCRQLMEHPQDFGAPLAKIKLTGKEQRLIIHLEDHKRTRKPLLIFSALTKQHWRLKKICEDMGFRVGVINGQVPVKERNRVDLEFQAGNIDIVIASGATAGVGYNWGHLDHVIFASLDYMDSSFVQGYRRAIRGKRETPLLITVLEYERSMDQRIFTIIEKKSKLANAVDDSKERIKLRIATKVTFDT